MKKKNGFLITLLSIGLGMIAGGIILYLAGYNPFLAYEIIITGIIGKPKYIAYTIIRSTPIILTGISVAFAFKTGLFNIGAEGQYIIGSLFAAMVGIYGGFLPPVLHAIVAIIVGGLAAALWGGLVGFLKAKRGVNEVIASIMLNWIALYFNNYLLSFDFLRRPSSDSSYKVLDSAKINILGKWKVSESGRAFLSNNDFLRDIFTTPLNYGFLIAIVVAVIIWYILKHTTLGYQLRAVGFNKDAAEYAGIDIQKNIIRSMAIAGLIAGIAGATQVLGVNHQVSMLAVSEQYGFDGMAVSLIGGNNPLATIPAGLLFGGLKYGGGKLNSSQIKAPSEVVNIIIGTIVFFVAMPKLFTFLSSKLRKKEGGSKDA